MENKDEEEKCLILPTNQYEVISNDQEPVLIRNQDSRNNFQNERTYDRFKKTINPHQILRNRTRHNDSHPTPKTRPGNTPYNEIVNKGKKVCLSLELVWLRGSDIKSVIGF